jgi:hypothetical protein
MFCDICQPQPVWCLDGEAAVDQVVLGRRSGPVATVSSPVKTLQTGLAHQPGDPLVAHRQPQPSVNSASTRGQPYVSRIGVHFLNMFEQ